MSRLAQVAHEVVRILVLGQRAQVDAVHPVELLVVERGGARNDAVEVEAVDQLVARHDRRLVVIAPAEQRQKVDERRRVVAVVAEVVHRHRAVSLGQALPVGAEDV